MGCRERIEKEKERCQERESAKRRGGEKGRGERKKGEKENKEEGQGKGERKGIAAIGQCTATPPTVFREAYTPLRPTSNQ